MVYKPAGFARNGKMKYMSANKEENELVSPMQPLENAGKKVIVPFFNEYMYR